MTYLPRTSETQMPPWMKVVPPPPIPIGIKLERTEDGSLVVRWDSIEDCVRQVEGTKPTSMPELGRVYYSTWKDAFAGARESNPRGAEEIRELSELLKRDMPPPRSRKRRGTWDEDHGDDLDRDRLYDGNAPWRRTVRQVTQGPRTVVIAVGVAAYGSHSTNECKWRGIAAVVLTDLLEQAGYSVELQVVRSVKLNVGDEATVITSITAKQTNEPLDIDSLATAVSVGFYRTVLLQTNALWGGRYGASRPRHINGACEYLSSRDALLIEVDDMWSLDAAKAFVEQKLKELQ